MQCSAFLSNSVVGSQGGVGCCCYEPCCSGKPGGPGGDGAGGALFNAGTAWLVNSTFAWNTGTGGDGGQGGEAGYYSGCPGPLAGGAGGNGGSGFGGLYCAGVCLLTNCTVASNFSTRGNGGQGGYGGGQLPGQGPTGPYGSPGTAGVALAGTGIYGVNSLLASNAPANGSMTIVDGGHNLSSDSSCGFITVGSLNGTDPKLAPLADNGGPTLTMALLPGSPAIDAGNTSLAPATDQRGVARPFGLAADIGAFEFWPELQANRAPAGGINIVASGIAGQTCRLLGSSNLTSWLPFATNQIGTNGTALFHDDGAGGARRFYRLVMP